MDQPLDDSYLEIGRARKQFAELLADVERVGEEQPLRIEGIVEPATGKMEFEIVSLPSWPPEWAVIVGEVANHLRSALDYLVFQLAAKGGGNPEEGRTAFPISEKSGAYFRERGRKPSYRDTCLQGVDPEWAQKIDEFQPFRRHQSGVVSQAIELTVLNWLTNRAKHKRRHQCLSLVRLPFVLLTVEDPKFLRGIKVSYEPIDEGEGRFKFEGHATGSARGGNELLLGIDPIFPPIAEPGISCVFGIQRISLEQIAEMIDWVAFIIGHFKAAFDPSGPDKTEI
jgi:hypothetical protein